MVLIGGVYFSSKIIFKTPRSLTTYKKQNDQITFYPSTQTELSKITDTETIRKPASLHDQVTTKKTRNWEVNLSRELLKFQENDTKVIIQDLEELSIVESGQLRPVQKVIITYLHPNNRQSSATALVDLQNGKIIKAWNRTKHEDLSHKSLQLTPTNL